MTQRLLKQIGVSLARCALVVGALAAPSAVVAHPADLSMSSFAAGLAHPWHGVDHMIAMILVGAWAMQLGGRARWAAPLTFIAAMIVGSLSANSVGAIAGVEQFIALSVLVLGALVALRARLAPWSAGLLVAACAVMHGAAHGVGAPAEAAHAPFTAGFVISTFALHAGGLAAAFALLRARGDGILRAAGASAALAGAMLMVA